MRATQFINELDYPGNIGMMEFVKFQKVATPEEKIRMKFLLSTDKKAAWNFLQKVVGTKLHPLEEEALYEIDMSPSNLKQLAAKTGAIAGMEFEMVVPDTEGDEEPEMEPDFDQDERARSFDAVQNFFHDGDYNDRRTMQRFMQRLAQDYEEWSNEKLSELWEDEKDEYFRDEMKDEFDFDTVREDVAEELGLAPDSDEVTERVHEMFDEFVDDEWKSQGRLYNNIYERWLEDADMPDESDFFYDRGMQWMSDVYNEYSGDINWPHHTTVPSGGERSIQDVGEDFSNMIGKPVNVSGSYHGARRDPNKYVVEPDSSIDGDYPTDSGLEFVSPPMPIDEMLSDLQKTIKWAKNNGCYTNDSTGLHMNVSIPNKDMKQLDFVKLALLLGDKYVLEQFGRQANTYTKSALEKIKARANTNPNTSQTLMDQMRKGLSSLASAVIADSFEKYTSINPKGNYIEFRSPGGDWLNEDFNKLSNTLLRFVVALDAALDPQKYRQEYLKKLYQILQPKSQEDPIAIFAKYSAGALPQSALKSFIKQVQLQRKLLGKGNMTPDGTTKYWWEVGVNGLSITVKVVATSAEEAKQRALDSVPEWKQNRHPAEMWAKPVRLYDLDTPRNEFYPQGSVQ